MRSTKTALGELVSQPVEALGGGRTAERWMTLYRWARTGTVSAARLAEAHLDATAILAEAGQSPQPGAIYGVWASGGPKDTCRFDPVGMVIEGHKPFCSGLGMVDRALVTAKDDANNGWLVEIDVSDIEAPTQWSTVALVETATGDAEISARPASAVGEPSFYLERVGFWHGAVGPAACWAGAAAGLVDYIASDLEDEPYRRAAQGGLIAQKHLLEALLQNSGRLIDADEMTMAQARSHAHAVRHLVERSCTQICDRISQAFGPRPFVSDPHFAQRVADVHLYCRQQHGDRDLAALAQAELGSG